MANSTATETRNILVDLPDYPSEIVYFKLATYFAAESTEGFPTKNYELTLSANGTGTQALPVPTTDAWAWVIKLPDGNSYAATLADGADLQLTTWLASAQSTVTAASLADQFAALATFDAHVADTTAVHGITDTGALETTAGAQAKADAAEAAALAADDLTEYIIVALSDETSDLEAGTAKATFTMPYAMTLTAVSATVGTAPTGSAIQVGINEAGVSILSTDLTIDAGETSSATADIPAVISDAALAAGAVITMDLDAVGSSVAGAGLKITMTGTRIP